MDEALNALSAAVGRQLSERKLVLACAESCTGGWVAQVVTATAGSSRWFDRGFVTYSNAAKQELLGVRATTLRRHGAVSEAVVAEMSQGVLRRSHAQWAVTVSGVAGPAGGTAAKPVGTVCFAWARKGHGSSVETCRFAGDRAAVRQQAVVHALQGLLDRLASGFTEATETDFQ